LGLPRSDAAKNSTIAADNVLDKTPRRRLANSPAIAVPEVTSQMSTVSNLMTRNEAPAIEKAKPALPSAQAADSNSPKDEQDNVPSDNELTKQLQSRDASSTSALSTTRLAGTRMSASKIGAVPVYGLDQRHWTVAGGVLQRSADGGQSWQESLRPSHPLLCFTNHGEEIWAGGQAGVLFHSTNGGATWAQVQPSSTSQRLSADITHIDLQGDAPETTRIAISTRNNEMWISTNGGKTWEKK
jgi:hypothetical protein